MEEIAKQINGIFGEQTDKCSTVCRQIGFALFGVVWILSKQGDNVSFGPSSLFAFLFLVLFLFIDVIQYFYTSIAYGKYFEKFANTVSSNLHNEDNISARDTKLRNRISDRSMLFFILKIVSLFLSFIPIAIVFIERFLMSRG
jgi:hypothetical protein